MGRRADFDPLRSYQAARAFTWKGKAVKEADDYFSTAVNLAARISRQARASGILVSETLKELTEDTHEFAFNEGREVQLTGVPQPVRVYEVLWQEAL